MCDAKSSGTFVIRSGKSQTRQLTTIVDNRSISFSNEQTHRKSARKSLSFIIDRMEPEYIRLFLNYLYIYKTEFRPKQQ
jgi:hypothetical protein